MNAQLEPSGFGKVVLIAPRPADGEGAAAAGAALENLARTTGVEWARLGIRVVVVRPRDVTSDAALADSSRSSPRPRATTSAAPRWTSAAAGLSGLE